MTVRFESQLLLFAHSSGPKKKKKKNGSAVKMSSVAALPLALAGYAVNAASNVAWFFPMLVAAIAYFHYELLDPESRPIDVATELLNPEYDFIIVGAGSAGT